MKKVYEDVAMLFRWTVIGVAAAIIILPTLVSVGYII